MPVSAPGSHPQDPLAQPVQPKPHLSQQPANRAAQKPSAAAAPFDAAAASATALQAPATSQTANMQSSSMRQQPQSRAWQQGMASYSMSMPGSQATNSHHKSTGQHIVPNNSGQSMSQPVGSHSSANHELSPSSGNAVPAVMPNGLRPVFPGGLAGSAAAWNALGPQAHERRSTEQAVGLPPAMTHQQQPQPAQHTEAGKVAAGDADASEMHGRPLMSEEAAACEVGKDADGHRNRADSVAHQAEAARNDVADLGDLPDAPELIEPKLLAGGEGLSHDLLAD